MNIAKIDTIPLAIPFGTGADAAPLGGQHWQHLHTLLVRVETDTGLIGWGDAFAYQCLPVVQAAVEHQVAPLALGRPADEIARLVHEIERALHLFGRYGASVFALSGLDIALWDIKAKAAGVPLHSLLGGRRRDGLQAYASLFRYGEPAAVADRCARALDEGYRAIKLHEVTEPCVRAARERIGDGTSLMVDTNCPWQPQQALDALRWARGYDLKWLEEPVFPPEDFRSLARLRREGIAIAAGENNCTWHQFNAMLDAGAVDYAQPSVTKVGGVSHQLKVNAIADAHGIAVMPHSPYFGPGFMATLHLAAAQESEPLLERFHLDLEATLYPGWTDPIDGAFSVPTAPGLGAEPDADVIREYRVR